MFQWLMSIPIWMQLLITLFVFGIFGVLMYFFFRGGMKAEITKDGKIILKSNISEYFIDELETIFEVMMEYIEEIVLFSINKKTDKQMKYAEKKLILIIAKKEENYYKLLKDAGVPENKLASYEDCLFYTKLVGNMIYSENGVRSTKSILRDYIKDEDYANKESAEYDVYVKEVVQIISQSWNRYLNEHYDSEIIDVNGDIRKRLVSREKLYEAEKEMLPEMEKMIRAIFDNAKRIYEETVKEKEEMIKKRKEKVKQIALLREERK